MLPTGKNVSRLDKSFCLRPFALKAYGCVADVLSGTIQRSNKFEARTLKGRLIGYESTHIYRVWIPSGHATVRIVYVRFYDGGRQSDTSNVNMRG